MHASNAAPLRLAQARIGAVQLGIPAVAVVRAIPVPDALSLMPLRGNALRGVIDCGGALVPVVDLARWVDVGSAAPAPGGDERILVLSEGGRTIGLQVDGVGGLVEVADASIRLHHGDNPEDVFHSAVRAPDGTILSLLEVGRLADLALAWSAALPSGRADAARAGAAGGAAGAAQPACLYALLDTGHGLLGAAPADLAEVVPMPALRQVGAGAWCVWRGRHLAVLPGAALMGAPHGDEERREAPLLAVFVHGALALGVTMRAVLQLRAFASGLALADGVTSVVFDEEGAEIRLLDTARLFQRWPEAALSKAEATRAAGPAQAGNGNGNDNGCAYVVFEADGMKAVPIGAIEHVMPLAPSAGATMAWQDQAIPLTDLRPPAPAHAHAPGHVLVAPGPHGHVGHVVSRVHSLIPAGAGKLYRMGGGARQTEFITAGEAAGQASYRIVSL